MELMDTAEYGKREKQNMRLTLALWCVMCAAAMAFMLLAASRKTILIADSGQQSGLKVDDAQAELPGKELLFREEDGGLGQFRIPLDEGVKAEHVVVENSCMDRELRIYIQDTDPDFYETEEIVGDGTFLAGARYEARGEDVVLRLGLSEVLECRSTLNEGGLAVQLVKPRELYEWIVVIDPAGGGSDSGITVKGCSEKELTLQVAKLLQRELMTDPKIKLYFTRTEDGEVSREERLALLEAVDADLYLGLAVSEDWENAAAYGIRSFYNAGFFLPDFGNVQWADLVTREATVAASNRAVGLVPAEEESILQSIEVPAAQLSLGYLTNVQERSLLQRQSYQEKLAKGIAEAIREAYTNTEKVE